VAPAAAGRPGRVSSLQDDRVRRRRVGGGSEQGPERLICISSSIGPRLDRLILAPPPNGACTITMRAMTMHVAREFRFVKPLDIEIASI